MHIQTPLLLAISFLAISTVFVLIFRFLKLGSVLGYLVAGALIAPYVRDYAGNGEAILHFSELGVVLFLFLVGLEIHPRTLWQMRVRVFGLGAVQMLCCGLIFGSITFFFLSDWRAVLFIAVACSFSSTAIVLQSLEEKNELLSSLGRLQLAILLFQDMIVIPFMILATFLSPNTDLTGESLGMSILLKTAALALLYLIGKYCLNPFFRLIGRVNSKEIFTAVALCVVLSSAALMDFVGMSMALGAFLAGLMLSESEYRHQIESDIIPFKSIILGLFFLAVGMGIKWSVFMDYLGLILLLNVGYLTIKIGILFLVARLDKQNNSDSIKFAFYMSQGGEFAFVMLQAVTNHGIVPGLVGEIVTLLISISMITSACLASFLPYISLYMFKRPKKETREYDKIEIGTSPVIIAGFGRFGQIIARVLSTQNISWTALDKNAQHIDFVRQFGSKVYFGDATRLNLLRAAGAQKANCLAICIDNIEDSLKIVSQARYHFPHLKIFVRTRNRRHAYQLLEMGVDIQCIYKELFNSSLHMTNGILGNLDFKTEESNSILEAFNDFDKKSMLDNFKYHDDKQELIRRAQLYEQELETLFKKESL